MKAHTNGFKEQIKTMGREIDSKITFTIDGVEMVLGGDELNAVTPSFQGGILKSVMKKMEIDSNVEIPIETILNYKLGVKVDGEYEYLDFGNYVVYEVEKQEDTGSYKITCYDKLLYSMVDYEEVAMIYPNTIREYINEVCLHLGLTFGSYNDNFINADRELPKDVYVGIGYTFRDVFDELAQVTASTICLNENDEVIIKYINDTEDTINEEFLKDINVNFGQKYGPINSIVLSRAGQSDNVYLMDEESVATNGLCELKIIDNQIMNDNNRSDYLPEILAELNGLEYYINDFSSYGVCYYDICDRYNVEVFGKTYSCVMFNDEILVTQGLEENIYTEIPEQTETDYKKADKTDRRINQTYIMVDKQGQTITQLVTKTDNIQDNLENNYTTTEELENVITQTVESTTNLIKQTGGANLLLNSQFFQEADGWTKSEGINFKTLYGTTDIEQNTTSKSELLLKDGILTQNYSTIIGKEYTIAFKYRKLGTPGKESSVKLYNGVNYTNVLVTTSRVDTRTEVALTYIASVNDPQIIIATDNDDFYISDLVIQAGNSTEWSQNANETRGLGHTLTGSNLTIYDAGTSGEKVEIDPNSIEYFDGTTRKGYYSKNEMSAEKGTIQKEFNLCGLSIIKISDTEIIIN